MIAVLLSVAWLTVVLLAMRQWGYHRGVAAGRELERSERDG